MEKQETMHPPEGSSTPDGRTSTEGNNSHEGGEESCLPAEPGERSNHQNNDDSSISSKSTSDGHPPPKRSSDNRVLFPEKVCKKGILKISIAGKLPGYNMR